MKIIGKIFACVLCLCVVIGVALYLFRPYADAVTVENIKNGVAGEITAQIGESCYELPASTDFTKVFTFEEWEQVKSKPDGAPLVRLRLAEEWVIELYGNGKAAAYYGYASPKMKDTAYYNVPTDSVAAVTAYIEENGTLHSKAFSDSHFRR